MATIALQLDFEGAPPVESVNRHIQWDQTKGEWFMRLSVVRWGQAPLTMQARVTDVLSLAAVHGMMDECEKAAWLFGPSNLRLRWRRGLKRLQAEGLVARDLGLDQMERRSTKGKRRFSAW